MFEPPLLPPTASVIHRPLAEEFTGRFGALQLFKKAHSQTGISKETSDDFCGAATQLGLEQSEAQLILAQIDELQLAKKMDALEAALVTEAAKKSGEAREGARPFTMEDLQLVFKDRGMFTEHLLRARLPDNEYYFYYQLALPDGVSLTELDWRLVGHIDALLSYGLMPPPNALDSEHQALMARLADSPTGRYAMAHPARGFFSTLAIDHYWMVGPQHEEGVRLWPSDWRKAVVGPAGQSPAPVTRRVLATLFDDPSLMDYGSSGVAPMVQLLALQPHDHEEALKAFSKVGKGWDAAAVRPGLGNVSAATGPRQG